MDEKKDKLLKYAAIKQQIKSLEDKAEELKEEVVAIVLEMNPTDKTVETDVGTLVMVQKRKYNYSEDVITKEEELKQLKTEEEAKGIAEYTVSEYLKFNSSSIE